MLLELIVAASLGATIGKSIGKACDDVFETEKGESIGILTGASVCAATVLSNNGSLGPLDSLIPDSENPNLTESIEI